MIGDVDSVLSALVREHALPGGEIDVVLDAPTKEWSARRSVPTIDLFLYDIREDLQRRTIGTIDAKDTHGHVVSRRAKPRFFKLSYLVTAWTQRPEDEHRLLTAVLQCILGQDTIPPERLSGELAELGLPLPITVAFPPPEDRSFADVWSALGGELKASLDVVITAGILPAAAQPTASPVLGPPILIARGTQGGPGPERRGGTIDPPPEKPRRRRGKLADA